jgi:hypothetical protein
MLSGLLQSVLGTFVLAGFWGAVFGWLRLPSSLGLGAFLAAVLTFLIELLVYRHLWGAGQGGAAGEVVMLGAIVWAGLLSFPIGMPFAWHVARQFRQA